MRMHGVDSKRIIDYIRNGIKTGAYTAYNQPKLIYVTPERVLKAKTFMSCVRDAASEQRLNRVVVDECHCCSQWGIVNDEREIENENESFNYSFLFFFFFFPKM